MHFDFLVAPLHHDLLVRLTALNRSNQCASVIHGLAAHLDEDVARLDATFFRWRVRYDSIDFQTTEVDSHPPSSLSSAPTAGLHASAIEQIVEVGDSERCQSDHQSGMLEVFRDGEIVGVELGVNSVPSVGLALLVPEKSWHSFTNEGEVITTSTARQSIVRHLQFKRQLRVQTEDSGKCLLHLRVHRFCGRKTGNRVRTAVIDEHRRDLLHELGVLLYISARPEETLLFTAPEHETNRPPRLDSRLDEHASRLDRGRRSHPIVGGSRCPVPTVDMAADNHEFIGKLRADKISVDVVELRRTFFEVVTDIELQLNRFICIQLVDNAVVVAFQEINPGNGWQILPIETTNITKCLDVVVAGGGDKTSDASLLEESADFCLLLTLLTRNSAAPLTRHHHPGSRVCGGVGTFQISRGKHCRAPNCSACPRGPRRGSELQYELFWAGHFSRPRPTVESHGKLASFLHHDILETE